MLDRSPERRRTKERSLRRELLSGDHLHLKPRRFEAFVHKFGAQIRCSKTLAPRALPGSNLAKLPANVTK